MEYKSSLSGLDPGWVGRSTPILLCCSSTWEKTWIKFIAIVSEWRMKASVQNSERRKRTYFFSKPATDFASIPIVVNCTDGWSRCVCVVQSRPRTFFILIHTIETIFVLLMAMMTKLETEVIICPPFGQMKKNEQLQTFDWFFYFHFQRHSWTSTNFCLQFRVILKLHSFQSKNIILGIRLRLHLKCQTCSVFTYTL